MKLGNVYHFELLDNCLHLYDYTHNVLADASFGLFQIFHVELGNPYRTSNRTHYLIYGGGLFMVNRIRYIYIYIYIYTVGESPESVEANELDHYSKLVALLN